MSKYSGKCDLADILKIYKYTLEDLKSRVKIYIGDSLDPVRVEKESDLIPYYPYIVVYSQANNKEKNAIFRLTTESWVDREERENLQFRLQLVLEYYKRCKRKRIPFDRDEALKEICWGNFNRDTYEKLVDRVNDLGRRASIDGLHLQMHELYRRKLVDTMMENGLNPAVYGYERFCTREL